MDREALKDLITNHLASLEPARDYRVRYYDPPIMDVSGGSEHYEALVTRWNGQKWLKVASGSLERVAEELGLYDPQESTQSDL